MFSSSKENRQLIPYFLVLSIMIPLGIYLTVLGQEEPPPDPIAPAAFDLKHEIEKALAGDGVVLLPEGEVKLEEPITITEPDFGIKTLCFRGKGLGKSTLFVPKTFTVDSRIVPAITFRGREMYAPPYDNVGGVTFEDIQFRGGTDLTSNLFSMEFATQFRFNRCMFRGFNTTVIRGYQFWDSKFDDCHFVLCGTPEAPVVALLGPTISETAWCNNIHFNMCRFEACKGTSIYFGKNSTRCFVSQCKFDKAAAPTIHYDSAKVHTFVNSQFNDLPTVEGYSIHVQNSTAILFDQVIVDGKTGGFFFENCKQCSLTDSIIGMQKTVPNPHTVQASCANSVMIKDVITQAMCMPLINRTYTPDSPELHGVPFTPSAPPRPSLPPSPTSPR